jgi:hypothetical protein
MQRLVPVRVYFGLKLFIMLRKYMVIGALIMHNSYITKFTGCDKHYSYKSLFAITAFFYSKIIIGQGFEPRIAP